MDNPTNVIIIGLLAVLFFITVAQATTETVVDNNIEWTAQHYATCSITSCYIDFTIKNKNSNLVTYDSSDLKAVASQIENSVLTAPQLMSHTIPVYGLKEAEYICKDSIGISTATETTTYYCYSDTEILFNRTYDSYDEESRTFTYSETVKISDQIVDDGIGYVEVSAPLQLNKTSTTTHRIYFDVPPNSKGKFDIFLSFKIGSTDYISTLDPLWDTTTQSEFNNGTYYHTFYNATGGFVQMSAGEVSGAYTSQVFDASDVAQWNTMDWTQGGYYGVNLPNSEGIETGLGGAIMTGNYLLIHTDGNWVDNSGNNRDGTAFGATFTTAKLGTYAGNFNGANNYVTFGDVANFERTQAFSVETWFKTSTYSAPSRDIISRIYYSSPYTGWAVRMSSGELNLFLDNSVAANNYINVKVAQNYADGAWHHLIVTYDGSSTAAGVKMYVDGVSKSLTVVKDALTSSIQTSSSAALSMGATWYAGNFWNGQLDETAIYTRVLSATEDYNHYVRGAFRLTPSVRSCDDPICSGESFAGIAGLPPQNLYVSNNRYFQYQFSFTRDLPFSPTLYDVTIDYTSPTAPASPTLLSLSMGLGNAFITDNQGRWVNLDYTNYKFVSMGTDLIGGYPQYVSLTSWVPIIDNQVYIRLSSHHYYGSPIAVLRQSCYPSNENITYADVNLSQVSATWESNGYAFFPLSTAFIPPLTLSPTGDITNASTNGIYALSCKFTLFQDNATLQLYASPKTTSDKVFPIPNTDLANLIGTRTIDINGTTHITGVRSLINAGFDIMDLMLILTSMFIFVFFLIFTYIMFEYFISLLKVREENE